MSKENQNPKSKNNILSNSLLPTRHDCEKPDMPFTIKTEPVDDENNYSDYKDLFSFIQSSKNSTISFENDEEHSNSSNISTVTLPMEGTEGVINNLSKDLLSESQTVAMSFDQVCVKQESAELEDVGNQSSRRKESIQNNHTENSLNDEIFTLINDQVKKEHIENNEIYENIIEQDIPDINVNFETEYIEKACFPTKRKTDKEEFEKKFQIIRKRLKVESADDDENQVLERNDSDYESFGMEPEEIIDNDIAVLPVPKVEKNIDVITISDDEDEEQSQSTTNLFKKNIKKRNFSIDTLKYFNVVFELDRHDCQEILAHLSKYKTKNTLQKFFPIVKKEDKSNCKVHKGDILFKTILAETESVAEKGSISPNVDYNFLNKLSINTAAPLQYFHSSHSSLSQYVNSPPVIPQHVDFAVPSTSQSVIPSNLSVPVSSNFGLGIPQLAASSSVSNLNVGESGLPWTVGDVSKILAHIGQTVQMQDVCQNSKIQNVSQNKPLHDPYRNMQLLNSHQNTSLHSLHQNSPIYGLHQNLPIHDSDQSLQLHDPHLRKKLHLKDDSDMKVINTFVPSRPVAPVPSQDCQMFPTSSTTTYTVRVPAPSSMQVNPRFAANTKMFPDRKGTNNSNLYLNVGRDDITQHFATLILQWNPSWMEIQKKTGFWPPICHSYPTVGYFYRNEMDYYNTYIPLHLLHVWYNIYERWEKKRFTVFQNCKVQSMEKSDDGIKISCLVELEDTQVWPKRDDIIWCRHKGEEAFLHVEDVKKKSTNLLRISKLKITLQSLHSLNLELDEKMSFCIMWNIYTACLQTEALNSLDNSIKELVLKPKSHANTIEVVQLKVSEESKKHIDAIFQVLILDHISVILVETYYQFSSVELITNLTCNIVYNADKFGLIPKKEPNRKFKVLIIVKSGELLIKLHNLLNEYKPVLAVCTKQISLLPYLIRHTLEDRLGRRENLTEILNKQNIFLTVFSAFGDAEITHLSGLKNLICIIDDAHLCTELETALPLTLTIKKLLLIGNIFQQPTLPDILRNRKYCITLFARLLKAKC